MGNQVQRRLFFISVIASLIIFIFFSSQRYLKLQNPKMPLPNPQFPLLVPQTLHCLQKLSLAMCMQACHGLSGVHDRLPWACHHAQITSFRPASMPRGMFDHVHTVQHCPHSGQIDSCLFVNLCS